MKIIAADDSATMRTILEMTFAGENAEVTTVPTAQAALEAIKQSRPDLVLADASMKPDGYELCKVIRSDTQIAHTTVILLASQHVPFDADKAKAVGLDDHINKPFDTQALLDKVSQALSKPRSAAASVPAASTPAAASPGAPARQPNTTRRPAAPTPAMRPSAKSTMAFGSAPSRTAAPRAEPEPLARPAPPKPMAPKSTPSRPSPPSRP
ncbi:MAG: response regulator, partial [Myxococcota bacterium]